MTPEPRRSTGIRLPETLHARLTIAAHDRGLSLNYLVNRAVEDFLDRLIPVEELSLTRDPNSH